MSYHFSCLALSSQKPVPIAPFLTLQEGKRLLQQLTPGSQEYLQLQTLLLKTAGIFEITVGGTDYKINTFSDASRLLGGSRGKESIEIRDEVQIPGLNEDTTLLTIGSHELTFSHIVALAGVFFALSGETISFSGGDHQAKTARFQHVFNTLKQAESTKIEEIFAHMSQEYDLTTPFSLFSHCRSQVTAFKKIKKYYKYLCVDGEDHFAKNAEDVYQLGHALALELAKEASKTKNIEKLKEAYAIDAFACHFLLDLFSADHIRNQSADLKTVLIQGLKFSEEMGKKFAGLLSSAQREEDGKRGLTVQNQEGKVWQAYGESCSGFPENQDNQERMMEAVQRSISEIDTAYSHPAQEHVSTVIKLIPYLTDSHISPLYTVKDNALIFYKDGIEHPVQKGIFALRDIFSYALKYLPHSSMNALFFSQQESSSWISKMFFLQFEQIAGVVWQAMGSKMSASLHVDNHQIGMTSALTQMEDHIDLMLGDLIKIKVEVGKPLWNFYLLKSFNQAVLNIQSILHGCKDFSGMWSDHINSQCDDLFSNILLLSGTWTKKSRTASETFLSEYAKIVKKDFPEAKDLEIKMRTTLWFRQILELQTQVFALYLSFKALGTQDSEFSFHIESFIANLKRQVETNQSFIDENCVRSSSNYIRLQLDKIHTIEQIHSNSTKC